MSILFQIIHGASSSCGWLMIGYTIGNQKVSGPSSLKYSQSNTIDSTSLSLPFQDAVLVCKLRITL